MKRFKAIGRDINTNKRIEGIGFKNCNDNVIIIKEDGTEINVSENSFHIIGCDTSEEFEIKPISTKQVYELHNTLMQTTIDYLKENNIEHIDEIMFSADGLKESIEYGKWNACTDSSVTLYGYEDNKRKIAGFSL